ncbi:unnamed protein product, partial [Urochloa humidicola]
ALYPTGQLAGRPRCWRAWWLVGKASGARGHGQGAVRAVVAVATTGGGPAAGAWSDPRWPATLGAPHSGLWPPSPSLLSDSSSPARRPWPRAGEPPTPPPGVELPQVVLLLREAAWRRKRTLLKPCCWCWVHPGQQVQQHPPWCHLLRHGGCGEDRGPTTAHGRATHVPHRHSLHAQLRLYRWATSTSVSITIAAMPEQYLTWKCWLNSNVELSFLGFLELQNG